MTIEALLVSKPTRDSEVFEHVIEMLKVGAANKIYIYLKLNEIPVSKPVLAATRLEALDCKMEALTLYIDHLESATTSREKVSDFDVLVSNFIAVSRLGLCVLTTDLSVVERVLSLLKVFNHDQHLETSLNARNIKKYVFFHQSILVLGVARKSCRYKFPRIGKRSFVGLTCSFFPLAGTFFVLFCDLLMDLRVSDVKFKILISGDPLYRHSVSAYMNDSEYISKLVGALSCRLGIDEKEVANLIVFDVAENIDGALSGEWIVRNFSVLEDCESLVDLHGYYGGFAYVALAFFLRINTILYKTEARHQALLPYEALTVYDPNDVPSPVAVVRHQRVSVDLSNDIKSLVNQRIEKFFEEPIIFTAIRDLEERATLNDLNAVSSILSEFSRTKWIMAGVKSEEALVAKSGGALSKYIENNRLLVIEKIDDLVSFLNRRVYIYVGFEETGSSRVITWALGAGVPALAYARCDCGSLLSAKARWHDHSELMAEIRALLADASYYFEHAIDSFQLMRYHSSLRVSQAEAILGAIELSSIRQAQQGIRG